jgi:group I intron endonuclease
MLKPVRIVVGHMPIVSGVYMILNRLNGKCYVGSAVCLFERSRDHLGALRRQKHFSKKLQNAYNKHGEEAFEFSVLSIVEDVGAEFKLLIAEEQRWIDVKEAWKVGYNTSRYACHVPERVIRGMDVREWQSFVLSGRPLSESHKRALSEAAKCKPPMSEEQKIKIGVSSSKMWKNEQIATRIKNSLKGRPVWNKGGTFSDESCQKMSESHKNSQVAYDSAVANLATAQNPEIRAKAEATKRARRAAGLYDDKKGKPKSPKPSKPPKGGRS